MRSLSMNKINDLIKLILIVAALFLISECAPAENQNTISDFGRQVAEDFLQQFVSLFEPGMYGEGWYWPVYFQHDPSDMNESLYVFEAWRNHVCWRAY